MMAIFDGAGKASETVAAIIAQRMVPATLNLGGTLSGEQGIGTA